MGQIIISSYKNPSALVISMAKRVTKKILMNNGVLDETEPGEASSDSVEQARRDELKISNVRRRGRH